MLSKTDKTFHKRMTIRKMIEEDGYTIVGEAGNGVEAVQKYMDIRPDVVMLDITMPEMNGVDTFFSTHAVVIKNR